MSHWIVIPVFNEAASIGSVVAKAARHGPVIVVDDGSTDASGAVAGSAGATVLRQSERQGKGTALLTGISDAIARGASEIVTLDGDGQHDADEIPLLLEAAHGSPRAVVIGGRLSSADVMPKSRVNALNVAGFFINWLTDTRVRDTQSGFRLYPASVFREITLHRRGFVLETEILLTARRAGYEIRETPITAIHHTIRPSRLHPFRDGVAIGVYIARQTLARLGIDSWRITRKLFAPLSRERVRRRHMDLALETLPYRSVPVQWGVVAAQFAVRRITMSLRRWWGDPQVKQFRVVAVAALVFPFLLILSLFQLLLLGSVDLLTPFILRFYSQEQLARVGGNAPVESAVGWELPT